jgi:hypothetical protein
MKFLHFSGVRLGAAFPEWPEHGAEIRHALRQTLARLFAAAQTQGAMLISCGDLFDSNYVSLDDVHAVKELCRAYPDLPVALLPGGRDPWGEYSAYRHLATDSPRNLIVLAARDMPVQVGADTWLYGLAPQVNRPEIPPLSALVRSDVAGTHVAVVYGDVGRTKPGPEDGMVMVSPDVTRHPFDYVALADGGPAERIGVSGRPACYAPPQGPFSPGGSVLWKIEVKDGAVQVDQATIPGIREASIELDVTASSDTAAVAQTIRGQCAPDLLLRVTLIGSRPADKPILERNLSALCRDSVLGIQVTDKTELQAPGGQQNRELAALWDRYRNADVNRRREWADALKLYAAGVSEPLSWQEAPWAH